MTEIGPEHPLTFRAEVAEPLLEVGDVVAALRGVVVAVLDTIPPSRASTCSRACCQPWPIWRPRCWR